MDKKIKFLSAACLVLLCATAYLFYENTQLTQERNQCGWEFAQYWYNHGAEGFPEHARLTNGEHVYNTTIFDTLQEPPIAK